MSAISLIHYYNRLNGNAISLTTLKEFHARVQKQMDADSHGPFAKDLKGIYERVTKGIKKMIATKKDGVECLELVPIDLSKVKVAIVGAGGAGKAAARVLAGKGIDVILLNGIEQIQNDKDFREGNALGDLNNTAYQVITDRILELIQDNGLIWRKPWDENKASFKVNMAHNFVTRHVYRGGNSYLTWLFLQGANIRRKDGSKKFVKYDTPYFFSFNQVTALGGKVKAGEKGWPVIYFKWLYKDSKADQLVPEDIALENGRLRPGFEKIPGIFYYVVFNYDQCDGLKIKFEKSKVKTAAEKIETAEALVEGMPNRPRIERQGTDAWYRRSEDLVRVPPMEFFRTEQNFYSTLFHELIHSTGHEKRVYREREKSRRFGDKKYAFEELIAELGASFLCGESGILYFTLNDSAAYIKNWSTVLREELKADPKFYFKAAGHAQRAADFIIDRKEADTKATRSKPEAKEKTMPAPMKQVAGLKSGKTKKSNLHKSPRLNDLPAGNGNTPPKKPATNNQQPTTKSLSGVDYQYHEVELGPYKKDFHRMFSDTIVQVHGMPGHGKTVWLLKYAQYLAEQGANVLYVAREEFGRSVFDLKLKEHHIGHKNLRFARVLWPEDLKWATVIFMDSVTALKLDHEAVEQLSIDYPNRNWYVVLQSTKDGDFRGSMNWEHLVDVAGEITNRKLILRKNRLDPNNSTKAEKLFTDDAIAEAKKKLVIRNAVKAQTQPEPTQPKAA